MGGLGCRGSRGDHGTGGVGRHWRVTTSSNSSLPRELPCVLTRCSRLCFLAERGNPVFDLEMMSRAIPFAGQMLTPMVERGLATEAELDEIVEIAVRLGLSVVAFDSDLVIPTTPCGAFLSRWLGPQSGRPRSSLPAPQNP